MPPRFEKLSVIIPAYNEEGTIRQVVERVRAVDLGGLALEIVVVDDASRDRTAEVLRALPGITPVFHPKNRGKGGAVKSGIRAATGDVVLIQDADLEYDPADYPVVLEPILSGRVEVVIGSRFQKERPRFFFGERRSPFFTHYVGNITIVAVTNFLFDQTNTDYEGCYKAFTKRVLDTVPIEADGFEFDNELLCKLLRRGHRLEEVPISYSPRSYEAGKKIRWQHGVKMLWTIAKWRVLPF